MRRIVSTRIIGALLILGTSVPSTSAAEKITLLYVSAGSFVGSFIAKDQGYFEQHGLDVDLSLAQNGSTIPAALVADSAQIGVPTPTVMLQANEQGLDLVVIGGASIYPGTPNTTGVIARADSGIKVPRDLAGKKVGVPGFGGGLDILSKKWVQSNGVDYHKVDWVELQFPQMGDALKGGLVDAVASINPFYTRVIDSKVGYRIGDYSDAVPPGTVAGVYVSTRAWATKNASALKGFRAALDDADAYIKDPAHLSAVRDSIAKYTKLPPQAAATIDLPTNLKPHVTPEGVRFWIEVSREQGLIKGNPAPTSLIAP